jgi:hypothetical protein
VTLDESPQGLATLYADIGRQLTVATRTEADAMAAVTAVAVAVVPGVEWASITRGRDGRFRTLAATDPAAEIGDGIQYELGTGPCVDAILRNTTFRTGDLCSDTRWPEFSRRVTEATAARSMLSLRLFMQESEEPNVIAGLNLYSTETQALDDSSEVVATLVATHGALAMAAAHARDRAEHLQRALSSNRDIGVAMGVLMATYKLTRTQAFDLLRVTSQNTNRKLADVAADVADTGTLDLPRSAPTGGTGQRRARPMRPGRSDTPRKTEPHSSQ